MMLTQAPAYSVPPEALRDRRRAWLVQLLYPVTFVAAFVVGEGLASALGFEAGGDEAPAWHVPLLAGVPAILVFLVPGGLALWFGRRAQRAGAPGAAVPMIVGAAIGLGFAAVNVLGLVAALLAA